MPEISVIVPVYNCEKYLHRCIESILKQTFKDFELILIDDGSKDGSGAICDEYAKTDKRIKVIHKTNAGQAAARNDGVNTSAAEWIHFTDADDAENPYILEFLYKAAKENNVKISVCDCIENEQMPTNFFERPAYSCEIINADDESLSKLSGNENKCYWVIWGKLIKKEIISKIPFTQGRFYEDNEVCCKWLCEARKIAICSAKMYFYYINAEGTTKSDFNYKQLDYLWALEQQIKFFRKKKYKITKEKICRMYFSAAINLRKKVMQKYGNGREARRICRNMILMLIKNARDVNDTATVRKVLYACFPEAFKKIGRKLKNRRAK